MQPLCVRVGGAQAIVRLSLFHRVEQNRLVFQLTGPSTSCVKGQHQAHFLSLSVSDAVADIQWKNSAVLCSRVLETFSVAERYVIVNNSCSKSFLSLSLSLAFLL